MSTSRKLTRDVEAVVIPYGNTVNLTAGTEVQIVNTLGGNFTILAPFGMARIASKDADALGETVSAVPTEPAAASNEGPPDEQALWDQLRCVFDPEIPVNIVDLGLVYSLQVVPDQPQGHRVEVAMTLTAPGCGMGPTIAEDARNRLCSVPGVTSATVSLVWDPPWNQSMISEEGKMKLGLI